MLSANGRTMSMYDWSIVTGISISSLWQRKNYGWTDEDVVNSPLFKKGEKYKSRLYMTGADGNVKWGEPALREWQTYREATYK